MKPVVFLDRDGVINVDSPDYIKAPAEFEFIPKSPEAVALLTQHGFDIILITNQSLIGRKMATPETLDAIFNKMKKGIETAGGKILDIFFCPHTPDDNCSCRKPEPGMILDAHQKYDMDISKATMVGDSAKDIECGLNAGCGRTLLVQTGNGPEALTRLLKKGIKPDYIASDLYNAACWIVNHTT